MQDKRNQVFPEIVSFTLTTFVLLFVSFFRFCGMVILERHLILNYGRQHLRGVHGDAGGPAWEAAVLRGAFVKWGTSFNKCATNKKCCPFIADDIPSVSGGMYSTGKLLSNKGEQSYYHLNVSSMLETWLKKHGHVMAAVFLAYGGSRFNWHVEQAGPILLNMQWLLTFIHSLLVCTDVPNKLVLAVFHFLSDRFVAAALAARAIFFIELISVLRCPPHNS